MTWAATPPTSGWQMQPRGLRLPEATRAPSGASEVRQRAAAVLAAPGSRGWVWSELCSVCPVAPDKARLLWLHVLIWGLHQTALLSPGAKPRRTCWVPAPPEMQIWRRERPGVLAKAGSPLRRQRVRHPHSTAAGPGESFPLLTSKTRLPTCCATTVAGVPRRLLSGPPPTGGPRPPQPQPQERASSCMAATPQGPQGLYSN